MPIIDLYGRAASPEPVGATNGGLSPIYIVGLAVAGVVFLVVGLWLGIYLYRKRRERQRRNQMSTAFLSVRGVVKDSKSYQERSAYSPKSSTSILDQNNMVSQVALPSSAFIKTSPEQLRTERDFITTHHRQSNTFPKPFSSKLQNSTSPSPTRSSGRERPSSSRTSRPISSRTSRFSVFSSTSSFNESLSSTTTNGGAGRSIRKVQQTFNPVLPDELCISVGEQLMILQSFDDGWCVVGRESGVLMPQPKSLFGGLRSSRAITPTLLSHGVGTTSGGNVELGMVPAWCFLKPVQGLRAERPIRSTSLGVTVQLDAPGPERNDAISWSNF